VEIYFYKEIDLLFNISFVEAIIILFKVIIKERNKNIGLMDQCE
jgi:hypothetical protein